MRVKAFLVAIALLLFICSGTAQAQYSRPSFVILESTTFTGSGTLAEQSGKYISGGYILVGITELGVAQTVLLYLEVFNDASGEWHKIIQGDAVTTEAAHEMCVGPLGCSTSQMPVNNRWATPLPRRWRLGFTLNNGTNATFSVAFAPW